LITKNFKTISIGLLVAAVLFAGCKTSKKATSTAVTETTEAILGKAIGGSAGEAVGKKIDAQKAELEIQLPAATFETLNKGEVLKVTFDSRMLFRQNSNLLNDASKSALSDLAANLNNHPDTDIRILCHTDKTGKAEYNRILSERRAKSVYDYLTAQNVDAGRMMFKGLGFEKPAADNKTEEGRALNRRVEIFVLANEVMIQDAKVMKAIKEDVKAIKKEQKEKEKAEQRARKEQEKIAQQEREAQAKAKKKQELQDKKELKEKEIQEKAQQAQAQKDQQTQEQSAKAKDDQEKQAPEVRVKALKEQEKETKEKKAQEKKEQELLSKTQKEQERLAQKERDKEAKALKTQEKKEKALQAKAKKEQARKEQQEREQQVKDRQEKVKQLKEQLAKEKKEQEELDAKKAQEQKAAEPVEAKKE
jgi:outer membrane protein OmpA-like peptidoglycan-associated protein